MMLTMRRLCLVGLALLGCICLPESVAAQCVRFSKDIPCEVKSSPMNQLHFGVGKPAPQKLLSTRLVTRPAVPANDKHTGVDCAMVAKPAPQVQSAARVLTPDPNVKHSMRVTVVPPCKGS